MKRKANRWIAAESVKRESIFQMGFGLDMDDQTISKFLTLVLKEGDFDFTIRKKLFTGIADVPGNLMPRQKNCWKNMRLSLPIHLYGKIICGRPCRIHRNCM